MSEKKSNGIWLCEDRSLEVWEGGELMYVVTNALPEAFMDEAIASAELAARQGEGGRG